MRNLYDLERRFEHDYDAFSATNKAVDDFFNEKAEIRKLPYAHATSHSVT